MSVGYGLSSNGSVRTARQRAHSGSLQITVGVSSFVMRARHSYH